MNNELADRQQAIKLRLAGRSVEEVCRILGRSPAWFHIWWRRYHAFGPNGLFDLTRANQNLDDVDPEPWVIFLFYSHPPLGERIAKAQSFRRT